MSYCITYKSYSNDASIDAEFRVIPWVLSGLSADDVRDLLGFLAGRNADRGSSYFVPEVLIGTMDGEYIGNPSWVSFEAQSKALAL